MAIKHNNAYAAIIVLCLIVITFIGMYVSLPIYGQIYNRFMNTTAYEGYLNQADCLAAKGYWEDGECQPLKDRPMEVINLNRKIYLIAPIIFIVGLIAWLVTVSLKQDPGEQYLR